MNLITCAKGEHELGWVVVKNKAEILPANVVGPRNRNLGDHRTVDASGDGYPGCVRCGMPAHQIDQVKFENLWRMNA